jgi:hypothetical protein
LKTPRLIFFVAISLKNRSTILNHDAEVGVKCIWKRGGEFRADGSYVATVGERADRRADKKYVQKRGLPRQDLKQLPLFGF